MARLIYFAGRGQLPLTSQIEGAGHTIFEALALSEVLHLIEYERINAVLIAPEIAPARRLPIKERITTFELTEESSAGGHHLRALKPLPWTRPDDAVMPTESTWLSTRLPQFYPKWHARNTSRMLKPGTSPIAR